MAFNFLQTLTTQRQNTNDKDTPVDKIDYNSEESDIELDHDEQEEVKDDIDSPNELNSDQCNGDDGLDLGERNPIRWGAELKTGEINLFIEHVCPKTEHHESQTHESRTVRRFFFF